MKNYKLERDVKKEVKRLLHEHGWLQWMPAANGFGRVGVSDFQALKKGVFMALETKFGDNKPTAMQRAFLRSVSEQDGLAFVVNEKNIVWFASWLQAFDRAAAAQEKSLDPLNETLVQEEDGAEMLDAARELVAMV